MAWPNPPATWTTNQVVSASDLNTQLRDALISVLPIGTLILRVANYTTVETAVEGRWLQCNGVAVSRTTYSALFSYLNGLTPALPFGTGDGTTTFNLPDLRGRAAWAEGEHTDVDNMGDSDGAAIANRSPSHYHNTQFGTDSLGGAVPNRGSGTDTAPDTVYPTTGNQNLLNTPAYLIAGSYFIKYTA